MAARLRAWGPRSRAARSVAGLRRAHRPATEVAPAFELAYVREAPGIGPVVLEIPGGPGMAVPLPYRAFRRRARRAGLDVLMVEHRGVGLSRTDAAGRELPPSALTVPQVVEDLRAVLDAEGVERAIVSGASYGSYVAAAFAVTHPDRVAGLVLDSPVLGAEDYHEVREHARGLLWRGDSPSSTDATRRLAGKIRTLVERDGFDEIELGSAMLLLFERGGVPLAERFADQLAVGRAPLAWALLRTAVAVDDVSRIGHIFEGDLVGWIAHGELGYSSPVDGEIFDPGYLFGGQNGRPFTGEHYDFPSQLAQVRAPAVVIVGDRDTQTPIPLAEAAARALPASALVVLPGHGHSALDSRPGALLALIKALDRGTHHRLGIAGSSLSRHSAMARLSRATDAGIRALLALDRLLVPFARTPHGRRGDASGACARRSSVLRRLRDMVR